MLLAILLGNLVYLMIRPNLPGVLAHTVFRLDAGLLLDLAICAAIFVVIRKAL
jgi:hypothetical protein